MKKIEKVTLLSITGDDLRSLTKPIVYVLWKDQFCLYVGRSAIGIGRPFDSGHDQREAFLKATKVDIYCCDDFDNAVVYENALIGWLRPHLNKRRPNADLMKEAQMTRRFNTVGSVSICGYRISPRHFCRTPVLLGQTLCPRHISVVSPFDKVSNIEDILDDLANS